MLKCLFFHNKLVEVIPGWKEFDDTLASCNFLAKTFADIILQSLLLQYNMKGDNDGIQLCVGQLIVSRFNLWQNAVMELVKIILLGADFTNKSKK